MTFITNVVIFWKCRNVADGRPSLQSKDMRSMGSFCKDGDKRQQVDAQASTVGLKNFQLPCKQPCEHNGETSTQNGE